MSNVGCRIFLKVDRPDAALVNGFKGLPVANIADEMNRFFCVAASIKPFNEKPLLGTAFTVKARVGDNLMLHKALDLAQPGDVIIVDAQGDLTNSITGEIMMTQAAVNGLAGVQPRGPYKDGPGEINVPISCGGVIVYPGDIVVGDQDGIVIIRPADAPAVLEKAKAKLAKEQQIIQGIKDRIPRDKSWVDKTLEKLNCQLIDDCYR